MNRSLMALLSTTLHTGWMLKENSTARVSNRDLERRRSWRLRLAFLLLLGVALAQVLWWMVDQSRLMREVESSLVGAVEVQRFAAEELLDEGMAAVRVKELFPALEFDSDRVRATARLAEIKEQRRSHLNQYRWEGAFFLVVLLLGMVVLSRAMAREVELRQRQENFLAAVTHELKSPLASLRLALQTMERRTLKEAQRRRLVDRNLLDLDRLEGLISNVLESSRLDAGAHAGPRQEMMLATIVDQVVGSMARVEQGECDVVNEVPRDLKLVANLHGVTTILRNLIDNAVEATSDVESPMVRIVAGADSSSVWLTVEDNGVGFEQGEATRLFEKFYRPGDEMTRQRVGTGLGLFLVRRFAELEGGTVSARSDGVGSGARFKVRWSYGRGGRFPK